MSITDCDRDDIENTLTSVLGRLEDIRALRQEHFVCLSIGCDQQIIACHTVFIGTLTSVMVHPREIFAAAIADHAMEVIVAHNHPSGIARPSTDDVRTTQQLLAASKLLGIPIKDHVILTRENHFSFREHGMLV